ncbi:MAG: hypothetical protein IKO05_03660 [Selenomonadaceae bacterium]|nr:hypothetical protein [Selenomonadaceae bacterium]
MMTAFYNGAEIFSTMKKNRLEKFFDAKKPPKNLFGADLRGFGLFRDFCR